MSPKEKLAHAKQALACLVEADKLMKIVNKPVDKGGHGCKHLTHGWGKAPQCTRRVTWARQNAVKWVAQCEADLAAHQERVEREERERKALENREAQKRVERVQFRRTRDWNAKLGHIQSAIADLERQRECVLNNMHAYGVEVQGD
jgi:hypothetical protein|tara:strand:- start:682 stop:1119 length:438 start_codon:yes stop_codon:yes gene_type:complete